MKNGDILYEGGFDHGKMHGIGTYLFPNGDKWIKGIFQLDRLNGIGTYEFNNLEHKGKVSQDAIYHDNRRICFIEDLKPGISIKWRQSCPKFPERESAIILKKEKKRGHYKVKLYNGKISSVNLIEIKFELDITKARIISLEMINNPVLNSENKRDTSLVQEYSSISCSANVYDVQNFFFYEARNEKELLESKHKKEKEKKAHEYLQHLTKLDNNKSCNIIKKERMKNNKQKEQLKKKSMKDTLLMEIEAKAMLRIAKQDKDEKVALSRHQASDYKRSLC